MKLATWSPERPRLTLSLLYLLWKAFILAVALSSPDIGYDTSSNLLASGTLGLSTETPETSSDRLIHLVRWDAIYYSQTAQRGLIFEQEWAFGIGLPGIISFLKPLIFGHHDNGVKPYIYTAILLSHFTHWVATLLLFSLASFYVEVYHKKRSHTAFIATVLYIVSPAGIFLSAPYAESTFASLSMLGFFLYARAVSTSAENPPLAAVLRLCAGVCLGAATFVRSNGVLGGMIFFLDAIIYAVKIISPATPAVERPRILLDLQFTIFAGLCVAIGVFTPQYYGYQEYCKGSLTRPWCNSTVPSIFTFVQAHYWNVGFLRYWTLSNAPLFLLAAPQLYILIRSGLEGCRLSSSVFDLPGKNNLASRLAMPQLALAVLALFSYHVQIISRLSSGYPFWYIWLAASIEHASRGRLVQFFVIYATIQAGLYASFLPPA